jgi:triosephosphate isomerase
MRRPLVAGNWKMNGTLDKTRELLTGINQGAGTLDGVDIAVFPPFTYLAEARNLLTGSPVRWGAQTLCERPQGAVTGEIAADMLTDLDCTYVLVGHSERRTLYAESDAIVAAKLLAALAVNLTPILCVGESLEERERGLAEQVISRQLNAVIEAGGIAAIQRAIIAYEPVWAIGTGKTATPQQAQEIHAFIRSNIAVLDAKIAASVRILYGGSVKSSNAEALFAMADIDGGLIGGASLDADEFLGIATAAMSNHCN